MTASTIANNLQLVTQRIVSACQKNNRAPAEVDLLAVSKTFPAADVAQAHACGQNAFGENYIQEGLAKIAALRVADSSGLQWHCIGPVQSNKTRSVAENFDWVQTIDRLKIAQRLSEQRPMHLPPLQVLIQVNADGGANKSGATPEQVMELATAMAQLPRLQLRGLMAIPEPQPTFALQLQSHRQVKAIFDSLQNTLRNSAAPHAAAFDTLSLGMTDDLEAAIQAGSTMVRVGSGIFGRRSPQPPQSP